jgi:hypothetical protein
MSKRCLRNRSQTGKHEFDKLCAVLDIDHRLTPPMSPQTNGIVERFNGRAEDVLQSHHFQSGEELEAKLHRYFWLYNQQLPQSALGSKTPLQAMKDWHKLKLGLFKKRPYYRPGCDNQFHINNRRLVHERHPLPQNISSGVGFRVMAVTPIFMTPL